MATTEIDPNDLATDPRRVALAQLQESMRASTIASQQLIEAWFRVYNEEPCRGATAQEQEIDSARDELYGLHWLLHHVEGIVSGLM